MPNDPQPTQPDQTRAPFFDSLVSTRQHRTPVSFHMPGHKFNAALLPELTDFFGAGVFTGDLNEAVPSIDYLHAPTGALAEAQQLAAAAMGADHTFFLINGSTVGNQAMLLAAVRDGQKVIIPRAAHRSVYAGLILSGATPIYIAPRVHPQVHFPLAVELSAVRDRLDEHPDVVAIHVTSPNYYGYLSDVSGLVELAHTRNIPLLVDEAHGAHLCFHPDLPHSAVSHGADAVVQSPHKTLGALTQAAWLHLNGERVSFTLLQYLLAILQSSSPNVTFTGSLDSARRQMALHGKQLLDRTLELAQRARTAIRAIPGLWCYGDDLIGAYGIAAYDPTKLVIRVTDTGLTGKEFAAELWARGNITVEFADLWQVICSVTIADTPDKIERLIAALRNIAQDQRGGDPTARVELATPPLPQLILNPRQATFRSARRVRLIEACGEVCAEQVIPYPPGIPLLMPGEVISAEMIDYVQYLLREQIKIVGPEDLQLSTVRVIV
ncbi:arginine decarboxylase [Thermoflexales bacterium]|nr:arginine decarboxylase [Thermoflexales bacterium]